MKRKHILFDHPVIGAIVSTALLYFVTQLVGGVGGAIIAEVFELDEEVCAEVGTIIAAIICVGIHRLWFIRDKYKGVYTFNFSTLGEVLICVLIYSIVDNVPIVLNIIELGGIKELVAPTITTFVLALNAGVGEEIVYRAIPASIMMKNNPNRSRLALTVILTSAIFGGIHMLNITAGAPVPITIFQVISCIFTGLFYCALYMRTGSILLPIVIHFAHDFLCFMLPELSTGVMTYTDLSFVDFIPEYINMAVELTLAIYLLRKAKWDEIKGTWTKIWNE